MCVCEKETRASYILTRIIYELYGSCTHTNYEKETCKLYINSNFIYIYTLHNFLELRLSLHYGCRYSFLATMPKIHFWIPRIRHIWRFGWYHSKSCDPKSLIHMLPFDENST